MTSKPGTELSIAFEHPDDVPAARAVKLEVENIGQMDFSQADVFWQPHATKKWIAYEYKNYQSLVERAMRSKFLAEAHPIESFGVTSEKHRGLLKEQVRLSFELSSHPVHFVHSSQVTHLEEQVTTLIKTVERLTCSNEFLVKVAAGKMGGHLCIQEEFVGIVSEVTDICVTVMYDRKGQAEDTYPTVQRYAREQFVGRVPAAGATMEAFVFAAEIVLPAVSPEPSLPTDEMFAGFAEAWSGSIDM